MPRTEQNERWVPEPNVLRAYLERTEFGFRVLADIEDCGYCILRSVLTSDECASELERWACSEATRSHGSTLPVDVRSRAQMRGRTIKRT